MKTYINTKAIQDGSITYSKLANDVVTSITAEIADSAPETLDTLNELAAALNDDPNFATTIITELDKKVNVSGYYPRLHVGLSDNLPDRGDVLEGVLGFRESAGEGNSIEDGTAEIKELMGESLVWNQKVITPFTTLNAIVGDIRRGMFSLDDNIMLGHKCLICVEVENFVDAENITGLNTRIFTYNTKTSQEAGTIIRGPSNPSFFESGKHSASLIINSNNFDKIYIDINQPNNKNYSKANVVVHNLTQMFGAGNEPTSVEEFYSRTPQGVDLYAYNEGEVISVNPTGIKSVNDNAFNGEYARVLGGKEYCIDGSVTSIGFTKELGGTTEAITLGSESKYTPSENGYIYASGSDICIHLVHTGYKGHDYVAHEEDTMPLDLTPYFPDGMHGINGVRDSVTKDKATRRFGKVDLGTLNWTYGTTYGGRFYSNVISGIKTPIDDNTKAFFVSAKYTSLHVNAIGATNHDKACGISSGSRIYVSDSSYTDATSFKAAMSGVMLYYELAEPIETEIDPQLNLSYKVWDFGTEELLSDKMSCPAIVKALYGFNATDTIRGNKAKNNEQDERLEVLEKEVVRNDDYAPAVTVGFADNLVSNDVVVESEFSLRQSGDGAILDGSARIEEVQGNSVVWNQQLKSNYSLNPALSALINNSTLSVTDMYLDWKVTTNNTFRFWITLMPKEDNIFVEGHKYIIHSNLLSNIPYPLYFYFNSSYIFASISNGKVGSVFITAETSSNTLCIFTTGKEDFTTEHYLKGYIQLTDLTQMFGAGNEPTTIEEFYARIPQGIDLYAYNAGEVIHSNVDAVKSVGRNVWDEEWEVGTIASGTPTSSTSAIRSKNYNRCLPNTTYYIAHPSAIYTFFYDEQKRYIDYREGKNSSFTSPANAAFFKLNDRQSSTYNHDICINLSDPDFNGQYEPYREDVRELPSVLKEVFPEGMMSAGTAHDVAYNDLNKEVGVTEKRIGVVDMGTLGWNYTPVSDTYPYGYFAYSLLPRVFGTRNILCSKYSVKPDYTIDKVIYGISSSKGVIVVDSAYTDVATFKAAMSGVMLYYELAEPEVQEHELFNLDYEARNGGQEEAVTSQISTPLKAKIAYGFNASAKIKENASEIANLKAIIAELQAAIAAIQTAQTNTEEVE